VTTTYTELPGPITADMLIDLIGRTVRIETPSTPEEERYYGSPTVGGEGILSRVTVRHELAFNGVSRSRVLRTMFDYGYGNDILPNTKVFLVQEQEEPS
jgi:hypothetical protein